MLTCVGSITKKGGRCFIDCACWEIDMDMGITWMGGYVEVEYGAEARVES